jgi:hypothetical protein
MSGTIKLSIIESLDSVVVNVSEEQVSNNIEVVDGSNIKVNITEIPEEILIPDPIYINGESTVVNSDGTYLKNVLGGNTLYLPDIINIDSDGTEVPTPAQTPFIATQKSGIAYQRPQITGQTTSYATYDDAWQLANGGYNWTTPTNPLYIQQLDLNTDPTGNTLLYNNAFGNKIRITNDDGTQKLAVNGYCVDNLTGLGHYDNTANANRLSWDDTFGIGGDLESLNTSNFLGYNDWFFPNDSMLLLLRSMEDYNGVQCMILPKVRTNSYNHFSSTTRLSFTTYAHYLHYNGYLFTNVKTTTGYKFIPTRIHF